MAFKMKGFSGFKQGLKEFKKAAKDYTKHKMGHLGAMTGLEGEIHRVKTELEKGKTPPTKQGFIWNDKIKKILSVWTPFGNQLMKVEIIVLKT